MKGWGKKDGTRTRKSEIIAPGGFSRKLWGGAWNRKVGIKRSPDIRGTINRGDDFGDENRPEKEKLMGQNTK